MLTLSDKSLIVLTPTASEWISQNISTANLSTWLMRSWPGPGLVTLSWTTGFYIPRKIEINKLVWPGGASRWGYFYGLIDEATLVDLLPIAYPSEGCQSASLTLKIDSLPKDDPGYEQLSPTLYLLTPIPLSNVVYSAPNTNPFLPPQNPSLQSNINNLFLLPLVDQRYFWWQNNTGLVNIPSTGMDWQDLFDQMAEILGISITADSPAEEYLKANPSLNLNYQPLAPYLDAIAYNIGQRIYLDINTNQVYSQNYNNARTARQNANMRAVNRTIRSGWYWYLSQFNLDASNVPIDDPQLGYGESNVLPVEVIVTFPAKACPPKQFCPEGFPKFYTKTITAEQAASGCTCASGFAGQMALRDQAFALFNIKTNPPTNQSDLDQLALQMAIDFYSWRCFRYDIVYNGVIAPPLDATIDMFETCYTQDDQYTRLTSAPLNGDPDEFHHIDETCAVPTPVVYVPVATRQGNFLVIPKAKLVEDNQGNLMLCTSSYDRINLCVPKCTSQQSSSHGGCPTYACADCISPADCGMNFVLPQQPGDLFGPTFDNPDGCSGLNGVTGLMTHAGGCTWVWNGGTMANPITVTLYSSGGSWFLEAINNGPTGVGIAIFDGGSGQTIGGGGFDCQGAASFTFDSSKSTCKCNIPGNNCVADVQPG